MLWKTRQEMAKQYLQNLNRKNIALSLVSFTLGLIVVGFGAYGLATRDRIAPGIAVAGIPIGNLTQREAAARLAPQFAQFIADPITFTHSDATWTLTPHTMGIAYDLERTIADAWALGRTGSYLNRFLVRWHAWRVGWPIDPVLSVDRNTFVETINPILIQSSSPGRPPRYYRKDTALILDPGQPSQHVDLVAFLLDLRTLLRSQRSQRIYLQIREREHPALPVLERARPIVASWSASPPILKLDDKERPLTENHVLAFFAPPAASPSALTSTDLSDEFQLRPPRPATPPLVNQNAVDVLLAELSNSFDTTPVDAVFAIKNGRVTTFRPSQPGKTIQRDEARALLTLSLLSLPSTERTKIALPVIMKEPAVTTAEVNSLGITTLLGRGISTFAGSIPGRIDNIELSSRRISGTLIPPGKEFSFNETIGDVSAKTGYKEAYVINAGRTVLDDGGGVCQTSTTLFRAVLNAGLSVVSRTAHAYRVGYYEQNMAPGFDATVYAPYVDFRFQNNTAHHILVQATVTGNTLTVDLYGTDDGRTISITEPVVTNVHPPPEPRYQDDPTLPAGEIKQVDWEAPGANVSFRRTVRRGEEILYDTTFTSTYRPWQAVYLKGSG